MEIIIRDGENESRHETPSFVLGYIDQNGRPQLVIRGGLPIDTGLLQLLLLRFLK